MADAAKQARATEADLVRLFIICHQGGCSDERLPIGACDTVVCEMSLRVGRADIVVFHVDGTASVIEAKDGAKGYAHVLAGIGQAGLYAAQIAMAKGAVTKVRRALLFSSTGNILHDALIEESCERASVIPLLYPTIARMVSAYAEVQDAEAAAAAA